MHPILIVANISFSTSSLKITSAAPAHKQAVILHDGPNTTSTAFVTKLSRTIGVGAIFITDFANAVAYSNIPSEWKNFVKAVKCEPILCHVYLLLTQFSAAAQ